MKKLLVLITFALGLAGCYDYSRCQDCGAAYKHRGFPGQFDLSNCRNCEGLLEGCSESESGWDEARYQNTGNEISRRGNN